jgi:hypothetical protein
MLFRVFVEGHGFRTCSGVDYGHVTDTRVHMYERLIGFSRQDQDVIDQDPIAREAHNQLRKGGAASVKHQQHAVHQGYLERYVLEHHPGSDYAQWLQAPLLLLLLLLLLPLPLPTPLPLCTPTPP